MGKLQQAGLKLVFGSTYPALARQINTELEGDYLVDGGAKRFLDGECGVRIKETLRRRRVVIPHSVRPGKIDRGLRELNLLIDACVRADADEVRVVLPYLPYARQDRKDKPRVSISASDVIKEIERKGARSLTCFDIHAGQIQGFSGGMPIDNLWADEIFAPYIINNYDLGNIALLSPDAGAYERAQKVEENIYKKTDISGIPLPVAHKIRKNGEEVHIESIAGKQSLPDSDVIIVDDIASTCDTLTKVAAEVNKFDPHSITAVCSHGVLVKGAFKRIHSSPLKKLVITDSIPQRGTSYRDPKIEIKSLAPSLSLVIEKMTIGESISAAYTQT